MTFFDFEVSPHIQQYAEELAIAPTYPRLNLVQKYYSTPPFETAGYLFDKRFKIE